MDSWCNSNRTIGRSLVLLVAMFSACHQTENKNVFTAERQLFIPTDTLVGRKSIPGEIAGSSYQKSATGYFVIINSDTSDLVCIVAKSKIDGKIAMAIRFAERTMSYRQQLTELKKILPEVRKDFAFDSLKSMYMGRLVRYGDLAVDVTKQYRNRFGETDPLTDFVTRAEFLGTSKLGTDLNDLFNPYGISVHKIVTEKFFFTSKRELYRASPIETDTAAIPEKILDCITWIEFRSGK